MQGITMTSLPQPLTMAALAQVVGESSRGFWSKQDARGYLALLDDMTPWLPAVRPPAAQRLEPGTPCVNGVELQIVPHWPAGVIGLLWSSPVWSVSEEED